MKQIEKHKKLIDKLKRYSQNATPIEYYDAIKYAINQLEQAQVFDEPVQMEVLVKPDDWYEEPVIGFFRNHFMALMPNSDSYSVHEARPIKEKPLEFKEWLEKTYIDTDHLITVKHVPVLLARHQQYLDNFNKQNK